MGRTLIILGAIIIIIGLAITFKDTVPILKNLGKLPGDINIQRENFSLRIPVATSLILSLIVSLLLYIISRFRG